MPSNVHSFPFVSARHRPAIHFHPYKIHKLKRRKCNVSSVGPISSKDGDLCRTSFKQGDDDDGQAHPIQTPGGQSETRGKGRDSRSPGATQAALICHDVLTFSASMYPPRGIQYDDQEKG
ncbi:hypothetical protein L249_5824 [Ophiocordyceps polyrhachis-furcata BCC 54312]|uniref:Uncharacterized protein n=1 Tax=Ophiocordyceps polyrhachis-furcata BCC 54312 TaxID=1330021 RepID=A0A367L083_9HYPO|nr:hypothetical protein L249_5824 [Ophiocordyceps polyrhachis-furcata BCC 54312]